MFGARATTNPWTIGADYRVDTDLGLHTTAVDNNVTVATDGDMHVYAAFTTKADSSL